MFITWIEIILLVITAGSFYFFGFRAGKRTGFRESYQIEINNRVEEFMEDQKNKDNG